MVLNGVTGKYKIQGELGRGGMGVVYLAEDTYLGRLVALKVLNTHLSLDEGFVSRFRREARAIASLSHTNIVQIHSLEILNEGLAIDMEYVEGAALSEHLSRRIPADQAIGIVQQVLAGLAVCHANGIVHRDVKPSNILITRNGRVLLADFGLATAYASLLESSLSQCASSSMFVGTPRYAPIEAWDGTRPTPAWDVYSVGVIMYEALTGCSVVTGSSPLSVVKQLLLEPVAPLREQIPEISPALDSLVSSMLERQIDSRPPDAAAVLSLLQLIPEAKGLSRAEQPTVPMSPPSRFLAKRRRGRRTKALALTLAGCALVGSLIGSYFWIRERQVNSGDTLLNSAGGQTLSSLSGQELSKVSPELSRPEARPTPPSAKWETESELMAITKSMISDQGRGVAPVFFDTSIIETGRHQPAHWMMQSDDSGQRAAIIAAGNRDLWHLEMTQTSKQLQFGGEWAEYQDDTGSRFRSGVVNGVGEWLEGNRSLMASLEFHCAQDNTAWKHSVSATRTDPSYTDVRFLYRIEESPALLPLLYFELMPRRLEWAANIEELFPCVPASRLEVPLLAEADAGMTPDGVWDEPVWTKKYYGGHGRIGEIKGRPARRGGLLLARATERAVLFGVRIPEMPIGQHFSLQLALCPVLRIPVAQSPLFRINIAENGAIEGALFHGDQEQPWQCDWEIGVTSKTGYWRIEMRIPIKGLDIPDWPATDKPWRLNMEIVAHADKEDQPDRLVAQWGYPNMAAGQHGMLIHFVKPREGGTDS